MANEIAKKEEAGLPAEIMDDIMATAGEGVEYDTTEWRYHIYVLLKVHPHRNLKRVMPST